MIGYSSLSGGICIMVERYSFTPPTPALPVGRLRNQRLALVVFRESPLNHIRIISARDLTAKEQRDHEQFTA